MSERIVVGVDGSENSIAALRWALAEAVLRQASVDVIHAWRRPYAGDVPVLITAAPALDEMKRGANRVLDDSVQRAGPVPRGVVVERIVVEDTGAGALLDASKGADLLVVGARGRGGFAGLLLGSVTSQIAHHARCPVVIVPAKSSDSSGAP